MISFKQKLESDNLELTRSQTTALQVNVGRLCNLACRHCHLEAGPARKEIMDRETAVQVVECARRFSFGIIDITGGAPEMNPNLVYLIENLAPLTSRLILRSNLVALEGQELDELLELCQRRKVVIIASFPSLNEAQAESQRGSGVFARSLQTLQRLNELGYGRSESGLELDLVSNPTGAFLPSNQQELEQRFRQVLREKWQLRFNNLYSFANMPLGRFRTWLTKSGNLDGYMDKLINAFNPCALSGVMCRSLISVDWNGLLYDCDFNQAVDLPLAGKELHIAELTELPGEGSPIALSDHCYACTAGSGFT